MECKAELHLYDDYGDNHATIRCQHHEKGHCGPHVYRAQNDGEVVITWERDDSESNSEPEVGDLDTAEETEMFERLNEQDDAALLNDGGVDDPDEVLRERDFGEN